MTTHEGLGEVLTAFKHSTSLGRTNHGDVLQLGILLEEIIDSFHEWVFGAYDHHINGMLQHKRLDALEVISLQGNILTHRCRTSVAWCNKKFLNLRTLGYLPSQGVLSAATTK